ncbi:MAG TPA: DUF2807 domain-containing protein [Anaeromyxobacteraceae bacterium]|nr:DUF2807 domain-containing protein [Anaeromyxobacteraceae bacterium]
MVPWHDLVKRVALASLAALAGCATYVNGNGVYHEETRRVAPFVGIAVDLGIEATVEVGPEQSVRLSGDANLVPDIETTVVNGVLVTSTWLEGFDPALPLRLYVTVPYLEAASAVGGSHVDVSGATATVPFEAGVFDGSEIHLAGAGGPAVEVSLGGNSHLDATAYPVGDAAVALGGASAAELRVSGSVTGDLHGGSSLQIYGGGSCTAVNLYEGSTCLP